MKRMIAVISALTLMLTAASCRQVKTEVPDSVTASGIQEMSVPVELTNHMTEEERSRISVGELTVFDHMQKETSEITEDDTLIPSDDVYFEIWTKEDEIYDLEHYSEKYPDLQGPTEEEKEESINYWKSVSDDRRMVKSVFIDKNPVNLFVLFPDTDYEGGSITIEKPAPAFYCQEENGDVFYEDNIGNRITKEEYDSLNTEFYSGDHTLTFADIEELKPYIREVIEESYFTYGYPSSLIDSLYEDNVKAWEAYIDHSYKELPCGTTYEWCQNRNRLNAPGWEIDREKVGEIAPYVREYNIYDEQLDTNFVVHVTLPPGFTEEGIYPAYVLTDGVWRFNNCADLRKEMEEGRASDVILVSIGYDYSIDGTDDAYRIRYFCERCEDFLTFITDDLMPYLGEEYNIDFGNSTLYGHSLGGTFAHYAVFNSDRYENQPFRNYIIGSPAFWSPGFLPYTDGDEFRKEYGYFDRNEKLDKNIFVCGGENEDPVYEEYYGENDSTLTGIKHFMERLEGYGVTTAESKIYPDSEHYQFIPEMLVEMLDKYYPA